MRPRIVIVDDDPSFLATVRLLLEAEGFVVVGEALNGLDGVAAAAELEPDMVLVDVNRLIGPGDGEGLTAAKLELHKPAAAAAFAPPRRLSPLSG